MVVVVRGVVATAAVVVVVAAAVLPGATAVMVGKMVGREGAGTLAGGAAGEAREAAGAGRVALAVEAMECSTLPSMWSRHPDPASFILRSALFTCILRSFCVSRTSL